MHSFFPFWIFTTSSTFLWSHFFLFSPHFTTNTNDQFWLHHICRLPHCSSREKKIKMKQQKSDGTVWPRWWHTRMFFFFLSLGEKQHSPSDNPPSICQVNVRNICRPRESNLLPPHLRPLTRQVLSGKTRIKRVKELLIQTPTGEKRLKSKGCGVGKKTSAPIFTEL